MKTLLQSAAVLALITVSLGAAVLCFDLHFVLLDLDVGAKRAANLMSDAHAEWQNEKADLHQIMSNAQVATFEAATFASEQRAQLRKTKSALSALSRATRRNSFITSISK